MALIKCPECGKVISDSAVSCIHCGFPIEKYLEDGGTVEPGSLDQIERKELSKETNQTVNNSDSTFEKKESKINIKTILILLAIVAVLFGPDLYKKYVNSQDVEVKELLGGWTYNGYDVYFDDDYTLETSNSQFITGHWEQSDSNSVRIYYTVSDEQLQNYYDEYIAVWPDLVEEGVYPTEDDVFETFLWENNESLPPEGHYEYVRNDNKLVSVEDSNWYISR